MKIKLSALALSGIVLLSGSAFGMDLDPKFYVGAEAQANQLKNGKEFVDATNGKSTIRKNNPSLGLMLGSRLNEYVGVEVGYNFMKESKYTFNNATTLKMKMRNAYVDALGYLPVANNVDLIGSIGAGRLTTKPTFKNQAGVDQLTDAQRKDSKTKMGLRLGVGAQYKLDDNLGVRFMVRHQKGNKAVKNLKSAGLGLFYQF